jgi:hypothetical protein
VPDRDQAVLRLQPFMIPALRTAYDEAITQLGPALAGVRRDGPLPEPWLGDEESADVAAYYTQRAFDGPNSSYEALLTYWSELQRVRDTLQHMEENYRRTEGDNAALWGRA